VFHINLGGHAHQRPRDDGTAPTPVTRLIG